MYVVGMYGGGTTPSSYQFYINFNTLGLSIFFGLGACRDSTLLLAEIT